MRLKAGNMPRNDLLEDGFDLQYTTRNDGPFDDEATREHFSDEYVLLFIEWPYNMPSCRFGNGNVLISVVQTLVMNPSELELDGPITAIGPTDHLMGVHLSEDLFEDGTVAKLRLTYGTNFDDARIDEYVIARIKPQKLN